MLTNYSFFSKQHLLVFLHILILTVVFFALKNSGIQKFEVSSYGLLNFDASWYNELKESGYIFKANEQSNSGFYPTFSFVWKVTHLSPLGISIFNAIVFLFSFLLLNKYFNFDIKEQLLLLSVPSLIFTCVPYTESLFFLSSTILIIGLLKEKGWVVVLAVFFCCIIRPVSVVFIPILIFIAFFPKNQIKSYRYLLYSVLVCVISYIIVAAIQWNQTGVWFAHTIAQVTNWDHYFHLPVFPLTTWGGPMNIWLDGTAFWLGILASFSCIYIFFTRKSKLESIDVYLLFSLAYLSCITFITLFLNGYNEKGQTSLLSLNRYFFATPFFFIAFLRFLRSPQLSYKNYIYIILSLVFVWLLFGAYTEIDWLNQSKTIIYFSLLTISVGGCVILLNHKWFLQKKLWIFLYGGNCLLQIYLLCRFLKGDWVG